MRVGRWFGIGAWFGEVNTEYTAAIVVGEGVILRRCLVNKGAPEVNGAVWKELSCERRRRTPGRDGKSERLQEVKEETLKQRRVTLDGRQFDCDRAIRFVTAEI